MAEDQPTKKRRIVRTSSETLREKAEKQANAKPKKRGILGLTGHYIAAPFKFIGRGLKKISRFIIPPYFRKSWQELKQVTWPSWRDTWKLTLAVILFSVIFGVIITVVDIGLDKLFRKVIL